MKILFAMVIACLVGVCSWAYGQNGAGEDATVQDASLQFLQVLTDKAPKEGDRCGFKPDCHWVHVQYGKFDRAWDCLDNDGNFCRWN